MVYGAPFPLIYSRILAKKTFTLGPRFGSGGVPSKTTWNPCRGASTASLPTRSDDGSNASTPPSSADLPLYSHLIPGYQEWYIPVTRRSLIGKLLADDQFGGGSEKTRKNLRIVAAEIDVGVANKYHQVLHDLKKAYFPVNPDKEVNEVQDDSKAKDTHKEGEVALWETRFLTMLRKVFKEANFQQLSHESMTTVLQEHNVGDGVMVSVNPSNYATLCFWVLDRRELKAKELDWMASIYNRYKALTGRPTPKVQDVFSRVIVAVRNKGSNNLQLKGYKDVPVGGLEQLLPDGKVRMRSFDRNLLVFMGLLGSSSMAMRTSNQLTSMNIKSGAMITLVISFMIALNSYFAYGNRRNSYLLELSEMHYYKNIANNLALVTSVIDRVQDEMFKESMLVYFHLISHGSLGMPLVQVERLIESWTSSTLGRTIHFDSREAIEFLTDVKLVARRGHLIIPTDLNVAAQNSVITDHRYYH